MNKNKQVSKTEEKRKSMVDKRIVLDATIQSLCKLNPKIQIKNPVMFVVYLRNIDDYTVFSVARRN